MENLLLSPIPLTEFESRIRQIVNDALSDHLKNAKPEPAKESEQDKLIRIDDVTELLGVSKVTLHNWRKQGKLTYHKIGRLVYFKENEVRQALKTIKLGA